MHWLDLSLNIEPYVLWKPSGNRGKLRHRYLGIKKHRCSCGPTRPGWYPHFPKWWYRAGWCTLNRGFKNTGEWIRADWRIGGGFQRCLTSSANDYSTNWYMEVSKLTDQLVSSFACSDLRRWVYIGEPTGKPVCKRRDRTSYSGVPGFDYSQFGKCARSPRCCWDHWFVGPIVVGIWIFYHSCVQSK